MKVLIVDDDTNKCAQLLSFLRAALPNATFFTAHAYQTGLEEALSGAYDIAVLDMTMPNYETDASAPSGRTRPFAGRDILTRMLRKRLATSVIIVTQFERFGEDVSAMSLSELMTELQQYFAPMYVGTIRYQPTDRDWQEQLAGLLNQTMADAR